jgi:hypothetical protein
MKPQDMPTSINDIKVDLKTSATEVKKAHISMVNGSHKFIITVLVIIAFILFTAFSIIFKPAPVMIIINSEFVQFFILLFRSLIKLLTDTVGTIIHH